MPPAPLEPKSLLSPVCYVGSSKWFYVNVSFLVQVQTLRTAAMAPMKSIKAMKAMKEGASKSGWAWHLSWLLDTSSPPSWRDGVPEHSICSKWSQMTPGSLADWPNNLQFVFYFLQIIIVLAMLFGWQWNSPKLRWCLPLITEKGWKFDPKCQHES